LQRFVELVIFGNQLYLKMDNPTVTVAVLAYNSSKFILETLESIKAQTYQNIKLIVTDDCSTDNTLAIVNKWLERNADRFIGTNIITSETNKGVTANCNRAFDACDTEWLKEIGGDDILLPNCIEDNVEYVSAHPDSVAVFSRVWVFKTRLGRKVSFNRTRCYDFFNYSDEEKYHHLFYVGNCLPGTSFFCNVDSLRRLDIKHDERIPLFEDYTMWITLLRKGVRFDYFDKETVWYRHHKGGVSSVLPSPSYYKSYMLFFLYYFLDEIKKEEDKDPIYNLISDRAKDLYGWAYSRANKDTLDYSLGHLLLSPIRFFGRVFKQLIYYSKVLVWRVLHSHHLI
jgi:alpha-1,3-rhamnosyltransferase